MPPLDPEKLKDFPQPVIDWFEAREPCVTCFEAVWGWCFKPPSVWVKPKKVVLFVDLPGETCCSVDRRLTHGEINLARQGEPSLGGAFRKLFPERIRNARVRYARGECPDCLQKWVFHEDTFHGTPPMLTAVEEFCD